MAVLVFAPGFALRELVQEPRLVRPLGHKPGIVPRRVQPIESRGCYEMIMWSEKIAKKDGAQSCRGLLAQKRPALAPSLARP